MEVEYRDAAESLLKQALCHVLHDGTEGLRCEEDGAPEAGVGLRTAVGHPREEVCVETLCDHFRHDIALEPVDRQRKMRPVLLDGPHRQHRRVHAAAFEVEVGRCGVVHGGLP